MIWIILAAFLGFFVGGGFWYGFFWHQEDELLSHMDDLISQAERGTFERPDISEEKLSAVEEHLKRYLDNSAVAAANQQEQKQMIQSLISDISHQTLTPVANMKIYTELLCEQRGEQSAWIDTIQEQADKLEFLIQSLVKLSRMESGMISVQPRFTEIGELFDKLQREYEQKAAEKGIALRMEQTGLWAQFDLKWTAEAVGNILDNAIKYTRNDQPVQVSAQAYSFFIRIDITDHGIGIQEEEVARIFTRFYRSFEVADEPGVGIGLYLAREIIRAQKGYIKVASQYGKGSTFSVFLPAQE